MAEVDLVQAMIQRAAFATGELAAKLLHELVEYDRRHGGDLVRTLHVYLDRQGNVSRAADLLYLHRSGLLYRLRRIEQLTQLALDDPDARLALHIALKAHLDRVPHDGEGA